MIMKHGCTHNIPRYPETQTSLASAIRTALTRMKRLRPYWNMAFWNWTTIPPNEPWDP